MARPTKLTDAIVDQVAGHLRTGHYLEATAALVGVSKQTLYNWLKAGARHRTALEAASARHQARPRLTAGEERLVRFLDAVEEAQAVALNSDLLRHAAIARGGLTNTVVTEKVDAQGNLVERTTRTETLAPNARALEWRIERRHPDEWGPRSRVQVTGKDGGPLELSTEERAEALADEAALFLAGAAAAQQQQAPADAD